MHVLPVANPSPRLPTLGIFDEAISDHLKAAMDVSVAEILRDVLHLEIGRQTRADMNCLKARGHRFARVTSAWRYRKP
jgi:hypothetical protein